jgi:exopolysaccharide biosynthesis polyprenyl glycosylphosphotransferase
MALLKLSDIMLVIVAFALGTISLVHSEYSITLKQFLAIRTTLANVLIFCFMLLVCHILFSLHGLYRSMRLAGPWTEMVAIVRATFACTVCFAIIGVAFSVKMMPPKFLLLYWAYSVSILCISRQLLRFVAIYLRLHGRNLRYLLVVGTNPRAVEFARKVLSRKELGYRLIGFVDDDWEGLPEFNASGFKIVSSYAGLAEYLRHTVVDEVAIYLPLSDFFRSFMEVASLCEQHGITMRFNADVFALNSARWRSEVFDGDHHIATYTGATHGWPRVVKRGIDMAVSGILIVLLLPVMICVAIAIKLTSPGPVFFLQERIGLNKRRFKIYKFRTMVPNAEKLMAKLEKLNEMGGPTFKMKEDPRITPIGKLLRRSSIDELPQLLNVFKGDMSLVGPRPLPVRDYQGFSEDWQRRRFSIKPGITCLWQVNGRSGITFDQWMLLDLQYLDEWSLWLDMKILAKTIPAVLKGSGAA